MLVDNMPLIDCLRRDHIDLKEVHVAGLLNLPSLWVLGNHLTLDAIDAILPCRVVEFIELISTIPGTA